MPVRLRIVETAMERVKTLYQEGCAIAKREKSNKPEFNTLIRRVVKDLDLTDDDRVDLVHEIAVFFGRRGGKKQPRKNKSAKAKPPKPPKIRLKKSIAKLVTSKPIALSNEILRAMVKTSRQAHEDICPLPD